jgi:3-oxoacyl-[acyl-carrier-protein] synthase-3
MASILGFGAHLPERVVTHEELAAQLGVEPDWILQACGIRERRYAAADETVVDLAEKAARACLARTGFEVASLGGILVGTGTPHRQFPGVSASLQQRLCAPGLALDIHLASSGGFLALCTAAELCRHCGPILVVAAEKMSEVVQRHLAKETAILFGDGAGACLVSPGEGLLEIQDWLAASDGTFADDLCLEPGGPLVMHGRQVIMQANRKLTGTVKELLTRTGTSAQDIDLFLFHQANLNLLKQVAKGLGIPEDKVFANLETRGNTSAASLFIAASEAQDQGRFQARESGILAAFGAGFSFGALQFRVR